MKSRPSTSLVAVVLATLMAASCTPHLSATTETRDPGTPPQTYSAAPISPASRLTDAPSPSTPEAVASQWFTAYHSARWTDPSPASWIDRVRPYVTPTMHMRDEGLRNGGGGTDWAEFVADRCAAEVSDVSAVLPAEAPSTDAVAYVLVIGSVRTTCSRRPPAILVTSESATLVVSRTPDGWFVNERLYCLPSLEPRSCLVASSTTWATIGSDFIVA
jgi:hypothetical protein